MVFVFKFVCEGVAHSSFHQEGRVGEELEEFFDLVPFIRRGGRRREAKPNLRLARGSKNLEGRERRVFFDLTTRVHIKKWLFRN